MPSESAPLLYPPATPPSELAPLLDPRGRAYVFYSPTLRHRPWSRQYLYSFYYALTTLVGHSSGIVPASNAERCYDILAKLLSALVFGYVVGEIGTLVAALDRHASLVEERLDSVNEYLRWRRVPKAMARRVRRFFEHFYTRRAAVDESRILGSLDPGLRTELVQILLKESIGRLPITARLSPEFQLAVFPMVSCRGQRCGCRVLHSPLPPRSSTRPTLHPPHLPPPPHPPTPPSTAQATRGGLRRRHLPKGRHLQRATLPTRRRGDGAFTHRQPHAHAAPPAHRPDHPLGRCAGRAPHAGALAALSRMLRPERPRRLPTLRHVRCALGLRAAHHRKGRSDLALPVRAPFRLAAVREYAPRHDARTYQPKPSPTHAHFRRRGRRSSSYRRRLPPVADARDARDAPEPSTRARAVFPPLTPPPSPPSSNPRSCPLRAVVLRDHHRQARLRVASIDFALKALPRNSERRAAFIVQSGWKRYRNAVALDTDPLYQLIDRARRRAESRMPDRASSGSGSSAASQRGSYTSSQRVSYSFGGALPSAPAHAATLPAAAPPEPTPPKLTFDERGGAADRGVKANGDGSHSGRSSGASDGAFAGQVHALTARVGSIERTLAGIDGKLESLLGAIGSGAVARSAAGGPTAAPPLDC